MPRGKTDSYDLFIRDFVAEGLQKAIKRRDGLVGKLEDAQSHVDELQAAINHEKSLPTA